MSNIDIIKKQICGNCNGTNREDYPSTCGYCERFREVRNAVIIANQISTLTPEETRILSKIDEIWQKEYITLK